MCTITSIIVFIVIKRWSSNFCTKFWGFRSCLYIKTAFYMKQHNNKTNFPKLFGWPKTESDRETRSINVGCIKQKVFLISNCDAEYYLFPLVSLVTSNLYGVSLCRKRYICPCLLTNGKKYNSCFTAGFVRTAVARILYTSALLYFRNRDDKNTCRCDARGYPIY